jgi:hypothetical protein
LPLSIKQVYYTGQSLGSTYGTLFHALEPTVAAAVLNGDGGTSVDVARLSISGRPLGIGYLAQLGLLNVPPAPSETYFHDAFNDNYVFRDSPPVINNVPGALAIQAAFEAADWLGMLGDPLSYAPHLKTSPLAGMPQESDGIGSRSSGACAILCVVLPFRPSGPQFRALGVAGCDDAGLAASDFAAPHIKQSDDLRRSGGNLDRTGGTAAGSPLLRIRRQG